MNEDLKAVRKSAVQMREGRAFHVMGTACAKAEPSPVRLVVATSLLFFLAYFGLLRPLCPPSLSRCWPQKESSSPYQPG